KKRQTEKRIRQAPATGGRTCQGFQGSRGEYVAENAQSRVKREIKDVTMTTAPLPSVAGAVGLRHLSFVKPAASPPGITLGERGFTIAQGTNCCPTTYAISFSAAVRAISKQ